MHYQLPAEQPPIVVVGPDDTTFWTALGDNAANRHALVIGDRTDLTTATVVSGTPSDLVRYIDTTRASLYRTVIGLAVHTRADNQLGQSHPAPTEALPGDPHEEADTVKRIALPHSGLRVPAEFRNLRISSYRAIDTPDGQAFNATLRLGREAVGTIRNSGVGGPSTYDAEPHSRFGPQALRAFVALCRTRSNRQPNEEELLDALLDEYQGNLRVRQAARAGLIALRMLVQLGDDFYAPAIATAKPVHTDADRTELARQLDASMPADDGGRWQIWTGEQWDDLITTPPLPSEPE
jgi:hypothetical protein